MSSTGKKAIKGKNEHYNNVVHNAHDMRMKVIEEFVFL